MTAVIWPSAPSSPWSWYGTTRSILPALASAFSLASLSGAARNLSRRWITETWRAISLSDSAQSTAVSPPPAITTRLPRKFSRCVT